MDEQQNDDLERKVGESLRREAGEARPPADLWARVRSGIDARSDGRGPLRFGGRWLALPATAVAVAAVIAALVAFLPRLGGDDEIDVGDLLARAAAAAEDPSSVGLRSYVAEVRIESEIDFAGAFDEMESDVPPEVRQQLETLMSGTHQSQAKVWFRDTKHFRSEFEEDERSGFSVADGEYLWTYDSESNTYHRELLDDQVLEEMFPFVPAPEGFTIEELIGMAQQTPGVMVTILGEEVYLGRQATVLEIHSPALPEDPESVAATMRFWLDEEYSLPLRFIATPDDQSAGFLRFEVAFTSLQFNVDLDDGLFAFEPPEGAVEGRGVAPDDFEEEGEEFVLPNEEDNEPVEELTPVLTLEFVPDSVVTPGREGVVEPAP